MKEENNLLLTADERRAINDAMPPEARYGDVFEAIAKAQLAKIRNSPKLREKIAECFYYFHDWDGKTKWEDVAEREITNDFSDKIIALLWNNED